jgi:hypothetical protein
VGLVLDFFDSPDQFAMHSEMREFVCAIKSRSHTVVLITSENDDGVVGEGH